MEKGWPWNAAFGVNMVFAILEELKGELESYIATKFPEGLIKIIRAKKREGLVKARLLGWRNSTGEVAIFFDSHIEVNIDWYVHILREKSLAIYFGDSQFRRNRTFNFIVSKIFVDKRSRVP